MNNLLHFTVVEEKKERKYEYKYGISMQYATGTWEIFQMHVIVTI